MVGSLTVAMVGLLVPWKDHTTYIHLASQVCTKRDDVAFCIAGSGDPNYTSELHQLAHSLGVAEK